jgi:acyl carrier protein phosphodiesterase
MNFLAHLYLSGDSDQVMLGNFIADFIKGREAKSYQRDVYLGILLHREIDFFTDRHRQVRESKRRLWQRHRHYSSVIVDIFYDHFLAKNWDQYSEKELSEFALHVYGVMLENYNILPPKSRRILPFMIIHNWLVGYSRFKDLQWVFNGMSRRSAKYNSGMEGAVESLKKDYENFENDFQAFFPDMIKAAEGFRTEIL